MKRSSLIGIFLLFFCKLTLLSQTELSGLFFSSHEVIQDKRTSLNLTPHKSFNFSNGFSLEFDINFRRGDGYYGYIFRIIGNDNTNIDLVSNLASDDSNIWLVYKDEILLSYRLSDLPSVNFDQWVKVRIDFDVKNSRLTASFNEKRQEVESPGIAHLKNFHIYFGICKAQGFYSTDVCPMSIKNISIYKPENKLFRQWTLGKHSKNKIYDNIAHDEAYVENPNWLIDKYIQWRKLTDVDINDLNGITPDANNRGVYIVGKKAVYHLTYKSLQIDTIPFLSGTPYKNEMRHDVIYNKYTDEIWSYDFTNPIISRFNLKTGKWSNDQSEMMMSDYGHSNKFISAKDSSLVTILGYGHYRYKGIVNIYDKSANEWKQIDRSEQITPRYLSSAGYLDESKALVFGGYGSKSGRQELSPRSYYDLYEFDFNNYSFTLKWTLPTPRSPFVPSETLAANPSGDSFYSLIFNNGYYDSYLQLARFKISQPEMKIVGDSVPFKFRDSETYSYLYLNEEKSDLIAVIAHKNNIALYAIAYPPLMIEEVLQVVPEKNSIYIQVITIIIILLLFVFVFAYVVKKYRTKKLFVHRTEKENIYLEPIVAVNRPKVSAIYLFGGFEVFDQAEENITNQFSPTLKQLFLFIFFHSVKERKGVTSSRLDEVLWYDKSGDSARNNRNVNIRKLRTILENVGPIEITNKNSLWQIKFAEGIYCDYLELEELLYKSKTDVLSEKEMYRLLGLLQTGDLLPNIQTEWIDSYRSDFIKESIEVLSTLLSLPDISLNVNLRFHIAEYLLSVDPLNEDAILSKCSLLIKTGKRSLAKRSFDSFTSDYEKLMGSPYPHSFEEIMG